MSTINHDFKSLTLTSPSQKKKTNPLIKNKKRNYIIIYWFTSIYEVSLILSLYKYCQKVQFYVAF